MVLTHHNYSNQLKRTQCKKVRLNNWAVVVAQLVERSPPTPEIRGSNPVIGKLLSNICLLSTVLKRQNKEKRSREWPI